ncbi:type III-A CRISPR-associated protein Csm2 [Picrophilus oshimae]|uniref:type III-A CRISPR-associated protein Csm2 n=1 Tax=Picrophilus oshimae TaxID=46632 RepID=UPI0003255FFB|nr:type III-A CRISPR-associated protein Csm2 [Picrophilus oshimae]
MENNNKIIDDRIIDENINSICSYLKDQKDKYKMFSIDDGVIYKTFNTLNIRRQIRKFYDEIVKITENYKDPETARGQLAIMLPIVYYDKSRNLLDTEDRFFKFMKRSIKTLNEIEDGKFKKSLDAYREVFQAIVAYTKEKNR